MSTLPAITSRWAYFWSRPWAQHYNRWVVLVWAINAGVLAWACGQGHWFDANGPQLQAMAHMVLGNFTLAILVRQQYVINALFWLATRAPTHWPLWIRRHLGKVFHFGGLHSGGTTAATVWFAILLAAMAWSAQHGVGSVSVAVLAISGVLLGLLLLLIVCAQPAFRRKHHNGFELVHRMVGWTALGLVWMQTLLFINDQRADIRYANAVLADPAVWMLAAITFSVILPWLRLKRIPISVTTPSKHAAVVTFDYGAQAFPGSTTALSLSPLAEWHSFANISQPGTTRYRIIISRAGDWTGNFINQPPSHIWTKGIITAGVANIETLFKKVLYVATGSGIGPVFPHLLDKRVPTELIWATRNPRKTYGDDVVDEILQHQPDALLWDTDTHGKPDLAVLAYEAVQRTGAEAVIVISNQKVTEQLVGDLEARNIPAYGAIFDS